MRQQFLEALSKLYYQMNVFGNILKQMQLKYTEYLCTWYPDINPESLTFVYMILFEQNKYINSIH